ncbi:MAG: 9-cis-epoxycarotenoid dioxygenase, partial [Actinobacteria bacterium]
FRDGTATYRNRWVKTIGYQRDTEAGAAQYVGMVEPSAGNPDDGYYRRLKDTANTDVVFHNGNLHAMWYLAGETYKVDPLTLETIGIEDWNGTRQGCVSAHAKVDERSGEFIFFDYGRQAPYMWYGVVSPDGVLKHYVPVPLPGARMPHDMWITENYSVLMDLPLYADPEVYAQGRHKLIFDRDTPSRFAVIPRYGATEDVRWFEADPCYIYHTINAWEDGDELVLDFCRTRQPKPPPQPITGPLESVLEYLRLDANAYRYRFNLKTGAVWEGPLDDRNSEFPVINTQRLGRKNRYAYNVAIESGYTLLFEGVVKYDNEAGTSTTFRYGDGRWGSESPFAPRPAATAEDDGYLVSFVYDANEDRSECVVLDAADVESGPVCRVIIPQRIPHGFHACWVPEERLPARPA